MEQIISNNGKVTWNVISSEKRQEGKNKIAYFKVECARCGYQKNNRKYDIQRQASCPGCSKKPAAVKTDKQGACISICEIGMVEFVRDYQEKHHVSERAAVRQFIETAKAHLPKDDPMLDEMTEESVNSKIRRLTGKKKDRPKHCGGSPQNKKAPVRKNKFSITADPEAVRQFIAQHLPGYQLTKIENTTATQQKLPFLTT